LRSLKLGETATDEGLRDVWKLPVLQTLLLAPSVGVTDEGLRHLSRAESLQELDLRGCDVSDAGIQHVIGLPALHTLRLDRDRRVSEGCLRRVCVQVQGYKKTEKDKGSLR